MLPFKPARPVRESHPRLRLVAFAAALTLALAAGCQEQPPLHINNTGGDGGGGQAGSSSTGAAGAGTTGEAGSSPTTTTTTTTTGTGGASGSSGSAGTGGVMPQPANFIVSLDKASATVNLDDQVNFTVKIQPNGYIGPVDLTLGGFGAGLTADLGAKSVTLDGTTDATTKLTITSLTSTPPGDTSFKVSGTVDSGTKTADGKVTVKSDLTIVIPQGVNGMQGTLNNPNKLAFGDYPMMVSQPSGGISAQNTVTVRFYNDDDVSHQIHAGQDSKGFPHDPSDIPPHSMDPLVRHLNAAATYNWYLHDEGGATTVGQLVIQ